MNNLLIKSAMAMVMFAPSIPSFAGNPCMPIAEACMDAGFYKGGEKEGKGLVINCVQPITEKQKTLPNTSFSDETLQQCSATIAEKMKEQNMSAQ
jgi:hypothetical protein